MDYSTIHDFVNHPWFELYNMIINAQIENYKAKLENPNLINPVTKKRYTDIEYEVMRWTILNLREIQNAPLEALNNRIYELDMSLQESVEKEIEEVATKMQKKIEKKPKGLRTKHRAAKA